MSLKNNEIEELATRFIITSIKDYCNPQRTPYSFKVLDLVVPYEAKVFSVIHGLQTSLGTKLWEKLAKHLASHNDFKIIEEKLERPIIAEDINNRILHIIEERKNSSNTYNSETSKLEIKKIISSVHNDINEWKSPTSGNGVDIWLCKDNINYLYDTKTVQPNDGDFVAFLEKIHNWYKQFYSKYPEGEVVARIGFPYNPYKRSFVDELGNKTKPLEYYTEFICDMDLWESLTDNKESYNIILKSFKNCKKEASKIIKEFAEYAVSEL